MEHLSYETITQLQSLLQEACKANCSKCRYSDACIFNDNKRKQNANNTSKLNKSYSQLYK